MSRRTNCPRAKPSRGFPFIVGLAAKAVVIPQKAKNPIGRLFGLGRRAHDSAVVLAQHLAP
jgi:hypothetical protein